MLQAKLIVAASFCGILAVALDAPFLQDISFRAVFQNADVVSVNAWEKLPFPVLINTESIIHLKSESNSDCFLSLSTNSLFSAASITNRNKASLTNPYMPWESLETTISGAEMLLNSYSEDFSFFVVTSNNIVGMKLTP